MTACRSEDKHHGINKTANGNILNKAIRDDRPSFATTHTCRYKAYFHHNARLTSWRTCILFYLAIYINLRRSSLHSVRFGQLLRFAHKHIVNIIVNIMKVSKGRTRKFNLYHSVKNIIFSDVGNLEVGHFRKRSVYEIGLIAIRDVSPLFCAAIE